MKRRKMAVILAIVMSVSAAPISESIVWAEEYQEDFADGDQLENESTGFFEEEKALGDFSEDGLSVETNDEFVSADLGEDIEGETDSVKTSDTDDSDTKINIEVIKDTLYVTPGGTATFEIKASSESGEIRYQWQYQNDKFEWIDIEGANTSAYEAKNVTKTMSYRCSVSNNYITDYSYFEVYIESGLSANGIVIVHTSLGEKIKLTAEAATEYGTLTYKWSKLDTENMIWREIPDATGKKIETDAITSKDPYRCIVDNGYQGAVIEFRIHLMTEKVDKEATCGAAGSKHKECSVCDKKEAATEIPATGKHSYGEFNVTKEATAVDEGTKVRTCSVCGAVDSAVIPKIPGTIQVAASKVSLQIKKSIALDKLVSGFAAGDSIDVASCTSSNASVAVIENGAVKAKKAGTTVVTIKLASGVSAQVTVNVQKKAVAATSINVVKNVTLAAGEKQKLTPVVSPITTLNKVIYSSTNKKVATVAKDGTITAKKSGNATIKVKCGKKTVNVKVKVTAKAPTGMTGVPATKTLKKGKSFTLKAKLTPSGAEAKITYKSSNSKIVSVTSKGKVKAKKKGTATITVKAGNVTKTCVVTVK